MFGTTGLTVGADTPYILTSFAPWDAADIAATDIPLGARPGVISGANVYKSRPVSFKVMIPGSPSTKDQTSALGMALRTAMAPSDVDVPLHFRIGGSQ